MAKKMSAIEALDGAIDQANAQIIGMALGNTDLEVTVGELLEVFEEAGFGDDLNALSVRTLRDLMPGGRGRKPGRPRKTAKQSDEPEHEEVAKRSTRTQEGRDALDTDVIAFLGGVSDAVGAQYVRGAVGGTPNQVRESLARLVERKMVTKSGQARSTEYGIA